MATPTLSTLNLRTIALSSFGVLPTPSRQIHHRRRPPTPDNTEHKLLIPVIDLLMLHPRRDQTKVSRLQRRPLVPALGRDGAAPARAKDDRVLLAVVVHRRRRARLGHHARRADAVAEVRDGVAALHALGLAARRLQSRALGQGHGLAGLWTRGRHDGV